jgi:hypothetical protein
MYLVVTRLVSWMVDLGGTKASPRTGAHTGSDEPAMNEYRVEENTDDVVKVRSVRGF